MKKKSIGSIGFNGSVMTVIFGVLAIIAITAIGTMICASFMNSGTFGEKGASVAAMIIWFVSSLCGTMISGMLEKKNYLPVILITAAVNILLMIGLKILLFDAPFSGIGKGILIILFGTIPSLLLSGKQKHGKKMKFKYSPK